MPLSEQELVALEESIFDDDPRALTRSLEELQPGDREHFIELVFLEGATACATALLDHGVDASLQIHGTSLVERACSAGSLELLDLLLARGAPIDGIPLVKAAHSGSVGCVQRLLEAGAFVDQGIPGFPSALGIATKSGNEVLANTLREAGATSLTGKGRHETTTTE